MPTIQQLVRKDRTDKVSKHGSVRTCLTLSTKQDSARPDSVSGAEHQIICGSLGTQDAKTGKQARIRYGAKKEN